MYKLIILALFIVCSIAQGLKNSFDVKELFLSNQSEVDLDKLNALNLKSTVGLVS